MPLVRHPRPPLLHTRPPNSVVPDTDGRPTTNRHTVLHPHPTPNLSFRAKPRNLNRPSTTPPIPPSNRNPPQNRHSGPDPQPRGRARIPPQTPSIDGHPRYPRPKIFGTDGFKPALVQQPPSTSGIIAAPRHLKQRRLRAKDHHNPSTCAFSGPFPRCRQRSCC